MKKSRLTTIGFGIFGLTTLAWLVLKQDIGGVATVFSLVGLNIIWLGVYRIIPIALDGFGWGQLFAGKHRPLLKDLFLARWLAESVNTLFPVAQIGGHVLRARIIGRQKKTGGEAGATVMVDFTLGLTTQILFTVIGLYFLLQKTQNYGDSLSIVIGVAVAIAAIGGFFISQRAGFFGFLAAGAGRIHVKKASFFADGARNIDLKVNEIYNRKNNLFSCLCWRLVAWIAKSGENWLFLFFAGTPITFGEAIILESLCTAFRSAAFFIPGGLGVQDGSLLLIGSLLGLSGEGIMALALAKRCRELMVGLPGLLWWFIHENRYQRQATADKEV